MKLIKKEFSDKYRKKWNIYMDDYVQLVDDNGKPINDSVYRKGGFFNQGDYPYFMLIKYVEEYYADNITKEKKKKPHLAGKWCILDKNGIEKKVFNEFDTPYLIKNSVIYSLNGTYYNFETGECYGNTSNPIISKNFIIIENRWSYKPYPLGVFKINKLDGTKELIDDIE